MREEYDWLFHEHSGFETMLEECIELANLNLWEDCEDVFITFVRSLKVHMAMEEEVLYPAYEQHSDFPQDPVRALRQDHDRLFQLVRDIYQILKSRDSEHFVDAVKPVVVSLHHHHDKEEDFFLPMAGHLLMPYRESIVDELKNFDPTRISRKWPI